MMDAKAHSMHPQEERWQKQAYFGWNAVVQDMGVGYVCVGDKLEVVSER
jgi:hypothetical protein